MVWFQLTLPEVCVKCPVCQSWNAGTMFAGERAGVKGISCFDQFRLQNLNPCQNDGCTPGNSGSDTLLPAGRTCAGLQPGSFDLCLRRARGESLRPKRRAPANRMQSSTKGPGSGSVSVPYGHASDTDRVPFQGRRYSTRAAKTRHSAA